MKITAPNSPLPLEFIKKKIKLVVMDSPYDTIQNELTQSLLMKISAMKITGYRNEYPYGVLPVDSGDFIGVHLLACEETADGLVPFMGFKSISYERCKIHHLEFPTHHICSHYTDHQNTIDHIVSDAIKNGERVAYNGSWTVDQKLRSDKNMIQLCYDLTVTLLVGYYTDYCIGNVFAGATKRFHVEKFKEFIGFEYLKSNAVKLDPIPCVPFFNEMIDVMVLKKFSSEAIALAKRYEGLWKSRLTIENPSNFANALKAA